MAWTESHTVLLRHRKMIDLGKRLGIPPVYAMGHLHALWHSALEQQESGDLAKWNNQTIASAAAFDGNPNVFVSALRRSGWLDGKVLHDWLDYAGRYLESRYRTSKPDKMAQIWAIHGKTVFSPSKDGKQTAHQPNLPTVPNQTEHNQTVKNVTPALPDVVSYFKELFLPQSEAERFFDHYTSNGWTQGRQSRKLKDWKAAARNWKRNMISFQTKNGPIPTSQPAASLPGSSAKCDRCGAKFSSYGAMMDHYAVCSKQITSQTKGEIS